MKILKAGFSAGGLGKTKGTEKAPELIIQELKNINLNEKGIFPIINVEQININQSNIEETNKNIIQSVNKNIKNKFAIIGGDHSITFPAFKAFSKLKNPGLLIFDAHPDCMHNMNPPTHEDFVKTLVEENIIKKENIILVGLRSWHSSELKFLKENKIRFFTTKQIIDDIDGITETIMDNVRNFSNLYISIDIDIVDPSMAPGTGYIEPAGLTSRQLIYMLQRISFLKNIQAIDLVEINPDKDINNITIKLGAKILSELI